MTPIKPVFIEMQIKKELLNGKIQTLPKSFLNKHL